MAAARRSGSDTPRILLLLLGFSELLGNARAYILFIEGKECLHQQVESGDTITGSFTVLDVDTAWSHDEQGGIDFYIEGPNNYKMYSVRNKGEDNFQIRAIHAGDYKFCLENVDHMAASVDLSFHVGHKVPVKLDDVAKDEHFDQLYEQLISLENDVWDIIQTQEHFKARDIRRKKTQESTGKRVIWYAILEAIIFIGACAAQLFILRRLFERKATRFGA